MDDVYELMQRRRQRFIQRRRPRPRKGVNYLELLKPSVAVEDRCPHTTQVQSKSSCSICLGVQVERSDSTIVSFDDEDK